MATARERGAKMAKLYLQEHETVKREVFLAEGARLSETLYAHWTKQLAFLQAWKQVANLYVFSTDRARARRVQDLLDVINSEGAYLTERGKEAERQLLELGLEGKCGREDGRLVVIEDI